MANPQVADCCVKGARHEGTPTGSYSKIGGYDCYVAQAPDKQTDKAILLLADGGGYKNPNSQLLADQFASNGFYVVVPDLFGGDPITWPFPKGYNVYKWSARHQPEHVEPIMDAVITALRTEHKVARLGATGYCFGGRYAVHYAGATGIAHDAAVDAAVAAHPARVAADDFATLRAPLALAAAELDQMFPAGKRREAEDVLMAVSRSNPAFAYQVTVHGGVDHGFAARGDLSDKRQRFARDAAFWSAVQWFKEHL